MTADSLLQELATAIYRPPLSGIRDRRDYPALSNPLHVAILLINGDTELTMQGVLGFMENSTGAHLSATITALRQIGARRKADQFAALAECMHRHGVTWQALRDDIAGMAQFQISTFRERHGRDDFTREAGRQFGSLELFAPDRDEKPYDLLCGYLDEQIETLQAEIRKATSQDDGPPTSPRSDLP